MNFVRLGVYINNVRYTHMPFIRKGLSQETLKSYDKIFIKTEIENQILFTKNIFILSLLISYVLYFTLIISVTCTVQVEFERKNSVIICVETTFGRDPVFLYFRGDQ